VKNVSGVLICVPAGSQSVTAQTMESIYRTGQWLTHNRIENRLCWFAASDIVEVRNLFLTMWYDAYPAFSHVLFVDSDMGFGPELIRDMLAFDKPMTGVLYAKRSPNPKVVGTLFPDHSSADVQKGFIPAHEIGFGVVTIKRRVVETMLKRMPELSDTLPSVLGEAAEFKLKRLIRAFDPIKTDTMRLSEDLSFCQRWRECDGEIWANIEHRISHMGPFDFGLRYAGILARNEKTIAEAA
jgi:hypothetical protein